MRIVKTVVFIALVIGFMRLSQETVHADTVCQQGCSNSYTACQQTAFESFDLCYEWAEFWASSCIGGANDAYNECESRCSGYSNCIENCQNQLWNAGNACMETWAISNSICYNNFANANDTCSTAYSACYNNCPPD